MGATASRLDSTRRKHRRKLPSLKSQRSAKEMIINSNRSVRDINTSSTDFSTSPTITYPSTPVNLVKHQVVLSDHVSPMSTLSAAISIPIRRSSWRKSANTTTTVRTDNNSVTSSSYFDDDDEVISSPRTSVGSEENNHLKVEDGDKKSRRRNTSSFSSFKSNYKKEGNDIVFESKYVASPSLFSKNEEKSPVLAGPPRPFWTYNNGDEREYDRQLRQHYVLKHVLDGNIHVPVSATERTTILDAACGAGFWTLDMANTYPNAKIIGLDTFPADDKRMNNYSSATISAPNIVYKYGDLSSHLSLPDDYLDIIYQRDTTAIMPHERWPFVLNELLRVAKPGGYLELVEYNFNIRDPGPVLALVNEWYKIASTSIGIDPKQAAHLEDLVAAAGFENVEKKVLSIPIGEWPTDEAEKEKGFLYKQVIKALFKSMKPWWVSELAVSEQEYDKVVTAAMDEFDGQRCSLDWFIYTARKPLPITASAAPLA